MKKYIFLFIVAIFSFLMIEAQNLNMQNGNFTIDCSSSSILYDSGGPGGSYSNNENIVMTLCPSAAGFGLRAIVTNFNIPVGDFLCIYDGDNTSAPSIFTQISSCLDNDSIQLEGGVFQSTVDNTTGCLTFQFSSNATDVGDFSMAISCEARCQQVISSVIFNEEDTVIENGFTYINLCLGDTLDLNATAFYPQNNTEYAQSNATSTFTWTWGDNSIDDTGQNVSHFYSNPGGYIAVLNVTDVNGCRNVVDQILRVRVAPTPQFAPLEDSIFCFGTESELIGVPLGDTIGGVIIGGTEFFLPPFYTGDTTFLPDGTGTSYFSSTIVSGFDDNALIENCGAIVEMCMSIEHSYVGDLRITLICPNGQSTLILNYPNDISTPNFGEPFASGTVDFTEQFNTTQGIPYEYCFSSFNNEFPDLNNADTETYTYTTVPSNTNGITYTYTDQYFPEGVYLPQGNFSSLVGCPINGEWQLEIRDNIGGDNGWLFDWTLNIHPCMFPEVDSFQMVYDFGYWDNASTIVSIGADSNTINILPDSIGVFEYTYNTRDQFGCEYNNTYAVYVDGFEVNATPADTTICSNEDIQINAELVGVSLVCEPEYLVDAITINMLTGTPTNVPLGDETFSPAINLPFSFEFFCNSYTQYRINSNGYISFDPAATNSFTAQNLPSPTNPNNLIALLWQDLNPGNSGTVSYFTFGTAPNRVFVTEFRNVPYFATSVRVTGQIQMFEETNIIEIHCENCPPRNGTANATIGIENATGTVGYAPTGFNLANFNASGRAWRFTPQNSLGAYTFNWTPTAGLDNPNIQNPIATVNTTTSYVVSVTNSNNCTYFDTATINVGGNFDYSIPNDTIVCLGESVQFTVSGGGESYAWTPNDGSINDTAISNPIVSPSATTTYTVTIDSAGCSAVENITVTVIGLTITNTIVTNESCAGAGDGSIEILPAGSQYSIDGGVTFSNSNLFTNLIAGSYNIVVGGGTSCDTAYTVSLLGGIPLLIDSINSTPFITCSNNDGSIEIFASGGIAPIEFSIDNGVSFQPTATFQNLFSGSYNIVVKDSLNCTLNDSVFIDAPDAFSISIVNQTEETCFNQNDGSVEISVSGGVPSYEYSIDGNVFSAINNFVGLNSGNYLIYVRDADLCLDSIAVSITGPDSLILNNIIIDSISCNSSNDGTISFAAQGGTPPYSFSIDNGLTFVSTGSFTSLAPSTYTLLVRDANNCLSNTTDITLIEPPVLTASINTITNVACFGNNTGAITTIVNGGTLPYSYSWSNGSVTQNLTNVIAGDYTLTVTDANNCTATVSATITEPDALNVLLTPTNVSCNGGNDGAITTNISGGVLPYTYSWSNGSTNADINTLTAGTYTLTTTDGNNCVNTQSIIITEPQLLLLNLTSTPVLCFGESNGTATVSVASGGVAPFSYQWDASANNQTTATATNLAIGNYSVVVTDANSCTQTGSVQVTEPILLEITSISTTTPSCFGENNGTITASATGGVGVLTYTLLLPNGTSENNTTGLFNQNITSGLYTLTVTDGNACTTTELVEILEPEAIVLLIESATNPTCFGYEDGQIQVAAFNGEEPYIFSLSDGTTAISNTFIVGSGNYTITVTDVNGCTATQNQLIENPAPVTVEILSDSNFVEMGDPLQLVATTTNTNGNISYVWTPSEGLSCTDCQNPLVIIYDEEEFTVTITDSLGCFDEASLFIEVSQQLYYFIPNAFTPGNTDGTNDDFRVYGQNIKFVEMVIFNRWGEKVFESASPFVVWDGVFKGELQQPGVYTYYTKITFLNDRIREAKGSVTLLR